MDSLIELFHIDIKLLVAQVINFAIVFIVLYFFALKPLLKIMAERSAKIKKSLDDAQKIEAGLENAKKEYNQLIHEAKKEANAIMIKANEKAEEKRKANIEKAKEEIGQIINAERDKMRSEKEEILKEIKKETVALAIQIIEKVLEEKIDKKKDGQLIEKMFKNL